MANTYRGEVEFEVETSDSEKKTYVLRLGVNQFISIKKDLAGLDGEEWLRKYFHAALVHGAESQKKLTIEDAGELMDLIGIKRTDDLIKETKYHKDSVEAREIERARRATAAGEAAKTLSGKIAALRIGVTDETALATLDTVLEQLKTLQAAAKEVEGSANPPSAIPSSS